MHRHPNLDIVRSEFLRQINEDDELRKAYKQWCEEHGHAMKNGYKDYIAEYLESKENIWDSLKEFEDDY